MALRRHRIIALATLIFLSTLVGMATSDRFAYAVTDDCSGGCPDTQTGCSVQSVTHKVAPQDSLACLYDLGKAVGGWFPNH